MFQTLRTTFVISLIDSLQSEKLLERLLPVEKSGFFAHDALIREADGQPMMLNKRVLV